MIDTLNGQPDDAELPIQEALLPWYATGRLNAAERAEVESALAGDPELRRRLALIRDEESETIALNENLGTPSAAAFDKLMGKIDLHEAQNPRRAALGASLMGWVSRSLSSLSPRTLAWSATAAAVVICLQAGLLTSTLVEKQGGSGHFGTASFEEGVEYKGTYVAISFAGSVSVQRMTDFLAEHHAIVLNGPKGGLYSVQIADHKLSAEETQAKLAELRAKTDIVSMIFPLAKP